MKRFPFFLAVVALASPALVQADTVYFSQPGAGGIKSVSGTIVKDTGGSLEIKTEDGRTVSIPSNDVFQIIRDAPADGGTFKEDPFKITREPSFSLDSGHDQGASRVSRSHYGIKGGMNFANLAVDPQALEEQDQLKSYAVGAWWGLPLNRSLTFRTEGLYSVKGDAESAGGYTTSTHIRYIDVPVLAKIGFLHDSSIQPSLFAGPALALCLSAKSTFEGGGTQTELDVKDQIRPVDVGLVVGGGLDFPLGGRSYGVELRYSKGLTNAVGDQANGTAHNDVLAVMASFGLQ